MKTIPAILPALLLLFPAAAFAIVIRHDRDDAAYRCTAADYPMVCRVGAGLGTLIDPSWVLTAAHVADALTGEPRVVRFGDRSVPVAGVYLHPEYGRPDVHMDLALIALAEAVTDIPHAGLQTGGDEAGRSAILVGDGDTGTGLTGPVTGERLLRAARNVVTQTREGWITFTFDRPPEGEEHEGISGPGDSGGPAFLERGDSLFVAGVSSHNEGAVLCTYGTTEHYARVRDARAWMEAVFAGKAPDPWGFCAVRYEEQDGQLTLVREDPERVAMTAADGARVWAAVRRLLAAWDSGSREDYLALFTERLADLMGRANLADMYDFMAAARARRGAPAAFHPLRAEGIRVKDSAFPVWPVVFHFPDGMPGYFAVALDDTGRIDHFSLFITEGACPGGMTCTSGMPLDEAAR
jgi:hypothetical protein